MRSDFAYFIASYNKPENLLTYKCLQNLNIKYPIYIVVGNDDPQLDRYKELYNNLIIYNKNDIEIDKIGRYRISSKICTYSRVAIEEYAKVHGIRYICYMFDDIKSMALRYEKDGKIAGISTFYLDDLMDMYIEFLNSSDKIYITGPPQSSFYIGISIKQLHNYSTRFGNMIIYDLQKPLQEYTASTIEDMAMVINNNVIGKLSVCPFGLQVNCRDPKISTDSYGDMTESEYYQQWAIVFRTTIDIRKPMLPYRNFIPKIISAKYKKGKEKHAFIFGPKKD